MGHRYFRDAGYKNPGQQHNIMAFVGNGFDIQVMRDYRSPVDTTYTSFFHFLKLRSFDSNNPIFQEMERLRDAGQEDWSDVEGVVGDLLVSKRVDPDDLADALREVQGEFSEFLSLAVPSSLLTELGADSMDRDLAINSLTGFLGDLAAGDYRNARFPRSVTNFDIYNFSFVNFNYTPLLDDYIYLDQKQFDPLPFRTVDRNFEFKGNPNRISGAGVRPGDTFSSYVMTEVIHPHGHQSIPRSLLFGIDEPRERGGNQDRALRLAKPFWAQNERRYEHLFEDTELFIVFGCSLGKSDRWWWRRIAESLGQERQRPDEGDRYYPELIIYWHNGGSRRLTAPEVRERFLTVAGTTGKDHVEDFIHVVLHDASSNRTWLNTAQKP
jgi:hypothetical protein